MLQLTAFPSDGLPTLASAQTFASGYLWVAILLAVLGVAAVSVWIALIATKKKRSRKPKVHNFVTLLVMLPKFRREEETTRDATKDQLEDVIAAAESFFASIGGLKADKGFSTWLSGREDLFTFEIVCRKKFIYFYLTIPKEAQAYLEQQLSSVYPDAHLEEIASLNLFQPKDVVLGSYMKLKRQNAFPIKTYRNLDKDPLSAMTNVLAKMNENESAAFQFVVRSAPAKWRDFGVRVASKMQQGMTLNEAIKGKRKGEKSAWASLAGKGSKDKPAEPVKEYKLSPQEEQIVKGLEEKAGKAGLDVCVRLVASGPTAPAAQAILANMINAFAQYNIYQYGNSFDKSVPKSSVQIAREFIYRQFNEKQSMVLNSEEVASLWHLPTPWTETPNIKWLNARRSSAPANIPGPEDGQLELGYNMYRGTKTPVWMKTPDRQRHMYVIGKSGSGKSQMIAKLAIQDIIAGRGVAVVEPHGDLIELILSNIPKDRIDDVIYFDPSDLERPMGLNMLEVKEESMKDFAVQEMISIFYKLFPPEMIGPMFEHHMRNAMLTLMADTNNTGTITDIPRMFSDADFQNEWRKRITDPVVMSYWVNEVDKTSDFHKSEMLGYLISKVGRFVENEMMRNIIGQTESSFDFREVMDQKKILLCNLSKGKTGDVNAELLGLIIVSKLQMAALGRADMPEEEREDFYLYIDEFQNFITDSIATILSEARKYRLNLIIAHQYVGQLVKNGDTKIKDAVFGNVGTMFVARVGPEDAQAIEPIYSPTFSSYDLINSDKFTWYLKMIVDNAQEKPFTLNFDPPPKGSLELAGAIKELSRLRYGRDRVLVSADILERSSIGNIERQAPQDPPSAM